MTRLRLALPLLLVLPALSCDSPASAQHSVADQPPPGPVEVDKPTPLSNAGAKSEPTQADGCGRGTGRNTAGECEQLRTREQPHAQQVQLPAAERFVMGDIPRRYDAEIGRHDPMERWSGQPPRYRSASSFWIDLHEVTRASYTACVEEGRCTPAACPDGSDPAAQFSAEAAAALPQTCVTHAQAEAFCAARGGRLPTEVEWEYAARGVDARLYPWGNNLRDEYTAMLTPVGGTPGDISYFGIQGLGTNAVEWVADAFEIDVGLTSYVSEPFRRADGPLRRAEATRGSRFVMKGGRAGRRRDKIGADRRLGFRCVADLGPDDTPLTVPAQTPSIPLIKMASEALMVFGGVAEAADRREAKKFCAALRIEFEGETYEGWRLPTSDEVPTIKEAFRGPGPFWATDGAIAQRSQDAGPTGLTSPWQLVESKDSDALPVRCVRDR